MNQRIAKVRRDSGKTQQEFAETLNLSKNFVSLLETGGRIPSDRTISDICKVYGVSDQWLRTGDGEMYVSLPRNEEIARFMETVTSGGDSFQQRLIAVLSRLSEPQWILLEDMANQLVAEGVFPRSTGGRAEADGDAGVAAAEAAYEKTLKSLRNTDSTILNTTAAGSENDA